MWSNLRPLPVGRLAGSPTARRASVCAAPPFLAEETSMRMMTRVGGVAACLAVLATARPVTACGYGVPSPVVRFVQADCVVVGKLTMIEPSPQTTLAPWGGQKMTYNIAVIKVEEMLKGSHGLTHVRLGLLDHQRLQPGLEACFFLTRHPHESFFVQGFDFLDFPLVKAGNPSFVREMENYRRMGKLSEDPVAGLRSSKQEDRFLTAALVIMGCRTFRPQFHAGVDKTEPIDALTSKLALRALAETDWSRNVIDFRLSAPRLFATLGVTAKDGWNPPAFQNVQQQQDFTRSWLKNNEEKFLVRAFVRK